MRGRVQPVASTFVHRFPPTSLLASPFGTMGPRGLSTISRYSPFSCTACSCDEPTPPVPPSESSATLSTTMLSFASPSASPRAELSEQFSCANPSLWPSSSASRVDSSDCEPDWSFVCTGGVEGVAVAAAGAMATQLFVTVRDLRDRRRKGSFWFPTHLAAARARGL